ncbi:CLUMA_CG001384, isoform A [Clunio marinus]|uniref:CLUMA_CG001384, isoform A n=1 Tax=Clunio marinus TaxID=568069 RepID=A0A1J1HI58_9DIPT|nr:CLUMA_CG001384, isoform A [Clunio marinus]
MMSAVGFIFLVLSLTGLTNCNNSLGQKCASDTTMMKECCPIATSKSFHIKECDETFKDLESASESNKLRAFHENLECIYNERNIFEIDDCYTKLDEYKSLMREFYNEPELQKILSDGADKCMELMNKGTRKHLKAGREDVCNVIPVYTYTCVAKYIASQCPPRYWTKSKKCETTRANLTPVEVCFQS